MLVDDDPFVLETATRLLCALGYRDVHAVPGPEEARHHYFQGPGAVDLLISDLQMPGTNGDELAAEFALVHPDLKVIFISGVDPQSYRSRVPLKQGRNFLAKPYRASELVAAIEHCFAPELEPA